MNTRMMPGRGEMIAAFLSRDGSYDGFFSPVCRTRSLLPGWPHRVWCTAPNPRHRIPAAGSGYWRSNKRDSWSVFAAMMKSFLWRPRILWVHQVTVTLPHSVRSAG